MPLAYSTLKNHRMDRLATHFYITKHIQKSRFGYPMRKPFLHRPLLPFIFSISHLSFLVFCLQFFRENKTEKAKLNNHRVIKICLPKYIVKKKIKENIDKTT